MAGEIAAGASMLQGIVGYKGGRQAARYAQQVAERDAQIARNEATLLDRAKRDEEARARKLGEITKGTAAVAVATSGVQFAGQTLAALGDIYFSIEDTATRIRYAGSIEQARKEAEVESLLLSGEAKRQQYKQAAIGSLIGGATKAYTGYEEAN